MVQHPETVSNREVKARWAYSELASPRAVRRYAQIGAADLFELKKQNTAFSALLPAQVERLVEVFDAGCIAFRAYVDEAPRFQLVDLELDEVCSLRALPQLGTGTLLNWAVGAREGAHDARLQSDSCCGDIGRHERIVIGRANVLIDGYFRTMRFLRRASPTETMPAYKAL